MLENIAGQPFSNGMQRRKDGFGMLATIPLVGRKVKVINLPVLSEKAPAKPRSAAKPKSAGKTKPATPLPPVGALPAIRTRGSKRKTTPHPVSATERRVSYSSFFFFFPFFLFDQIS